MFTGREWDSETGTYYYRARQYSPLLGRFLQRDPIGYYDSMNLYQYAFNSPNNFIDPWGEVAIAIPWVIWQAVEIGLTLWTAYKTYQLMDDLPLVQKPNTTNSNIVHSTSCPILKASRDFEAYPGQNKAKRKNANSSHPPLFNMSNRENNLGGDGWEPPEPKGWKKWVKLIGDFIEEAFGESEGFFR